MATKTSIRNRNNPNKLYILFAEDGSIVSLEDNNEIKQNGTTISTLNKHDRLNINVNEGDIIEGTGCFVGAGEVGTSNFSYLPEYMKGRLLQTSIERDNPTEIKIYPFKNGTVEIVNNGNIMSTITLVQGVVTTYTNNNNGTWRLNSNIDIIAQIRSGTSDPHSFIWGNDTKLGFASNSARISSLIEESPTTGQMFGNSNTITYSENGINSQGRSHSLTRNYENPNSASHITNINGKRVFAHSYADSDGNASATWLPTTLMYHSIALPHNTEFISFINRNGSPIMKYENNTLISVFIPTKTNTNQLAYYSYRDGIVNNTNNINSGVIYVCDEKMYAVYQNRESSIFASLDDETTLHPTQLNYKYIP